MNEDNKIFVGREQESRLLREAILSRQSLMIAGADGTGKTELILNVIAGLQPSVKQRCLYVGGFRDLHNLLRRLVTVACEAADARLSRKLHAEGITTASLNARVKHLSSSTLRGMLYRTVQGQGCRVFLDHCPALTPAVARAVKELFWLRQTPVYVVPSVEVDGEIEKAGRYFYWSKQQVLRLGPLPGPAARKLLEHCIHEYGLADLELEGFREEILELSHSQPGAMVAMCRMAANPRYQSHSKIKTRIIHIDYQMRGSGGIKATQPRRQR